MPNDSRKPVTPSTPRPEPAKPFEHGLEVIKGVRELIGKFGAQVEPALYALLCDTQSPTREKVDQALKGGNHSAVSILAPLLITQFTLAPAVAAVVAAVAVQAIAAAGKDKLCEVLAEARAGTRVAPPPVVEAPQVIIEEVKPQPSVKPNLKPKTTRVEASQIIIEEVKPQPSVKPNLKPKTTQVEAPPVIIEEVKPQSRVKPNLKSKTTRVAKMKTSKTAKTAKTKRPAPKRRAG